MHVAHPERNVAKDSLMRARRLLGGGIGALAVGAALILAVPVSASAAEPGCTVEGTILVSSASTGEAVGWLAPGPVVGVFAVTGDETLATVVSATVGSQQLVEIANPEDPTAPYVGAVVGPVSGGSDLAPGSANYAIVSPTSGTAPGAVPGPVESPSSGSVGEAAIWTLGTDNSLAPQWINSNGSTPGTFSLYYAPNPTSNGLIITGDLAAFSAQFPWPGAAASEIVLSLEETSADCPAVVVPAPAAVPQLPATGQSLPVGALAAGVVAMLGGLMLLRRRAA